MERSRFCVEAVVPSATGGARAPGFPERGTGKHAEDVGRGRVARQGEDNRALPRARLRGPGLVRTYPRPAQVQAWGRSRARLPGRVRGARALEGTRRRPEARHEVG